MKNIFIFILFVLPNSVNAQQDCSCHEMLSTVVSKIENIYVDRDNLKKNQYFRQIKYKIKKGIIPYSVDSCADVLYDIFSSFKDKHMRFALYGDFAKYMRTVYDSVVLQRIYNQFLKNTDDINNIEGLWQNQGGEQEFIITKDNRSQNKYQIVYWSIKNSSELKGKLKGTLEKISPTAYTYKSYTNGSAISVVKMEVKNNKLFSLATGYWKKKIIGQNPDPVPPKLNPTLVSHPDSIVILTLPSFDINFKPEIDSLLLVNSLLISKTKKLIIDIRENVGGTVPTYQSVLKWLYTNPIRIEGGIGYASRENIEIAKKNRSDSGTSAWFTEQMLINRMEKNLNKYIADTGYYLRYDTIYKYPKNIVVLSGYKTASAAELFLITAKQSKKVVIIGENSYGSIDRADMITPEHSCKNLLFTVPTVLRNPEYYKKAIDNIGIPPDIKASQGADWLQVAIDYLKKTN